MDVADDLCKDDSGEDKECRGDMEQRCAIINGRGDMKGIGGWCWSTDVSGKGYTSPSSGKGYTSSYNVSCAVNTDLFTHLHAKFANSKCTLPASLRCRNRSSMSAWLLARRSFLFFRSSFFSFFSLLPFVTITTFSPPRISCNSDSSLQVLCPFLRSH